MEPVIDAAAVVKTFGEGGARRRVLDGAGLRVGRGELVAVVGRSGSGKSTLLHLLGGLERADAGDITVAGVRVDRAGERALTDLRRRHVGFVFQFFHLLPELTALENVLLPARGRDRAANRRRAAGIVHDLGVEHVADRLPATMSGGEQQRVALARALVNDPAVLLADEPTGNLDTAAAAGVLDLLRSAAAGGRAVVVVTHEEAVTAAADRVLRLEAGRLSP